MSPIVSIIICTRNRVGYLAGAIRSVEAQEIGKDCYETIVVDNASSDGTQDFVQSRISRDSSLHYVSEPTIGLSCARNTGIRAARGHYLAFTDDDAIAEAGWLAGSLLALEACGPVLGCIGGKVTPIWHAPRPAWLPDELLGFIGFFDPSPKACWLDDYHDLYGCNADYKKEALLRVGGFSKELGRKGNSLLSNEDLLLHRQLKRLGYRTYYDPRISIRHHVLSTQLTKSWFRRRAYWQGVSDALLERQLESWTFLKMTAKGLLRIGSLAKAPREMLALAARGDDPVVFLRAFRVFWKLGYGFAALHSLLPVTPI